MEATVERRDSLPVPSRMARAGADVGEADALKDRADRALVIGDAEPRGDEAPLKIDAYSDNTVSEGLP